MLPLSQHSTVSTVSHNSKRSNTSNFSDQLRAEPKPKRVKLMTSEVVAALDRGNISSRRAAPLIYAIASALGCKDLNSITASHRSIHRSREKVRKKIAQDLKAEIQIAHSTVIHWDGKLLPDITGREKVERLPVIISGVSTQQLLGVPKLERGTGLNQAIAVKDTINEWNIKDRIKAMCFDTCATNTGKCINHLNFRIEKKPNRLIGVIVLQIK